jgi:hypothetical protein
MKHIFHYAKLVFVIKSIYFIIKSIYHIHFIIDLIIKIDLGIFNFV